MGFTVNVLNKISLYVGQLCFSGFLFLIDCSMLLTVSLVEDEFILFCSNNVKRTQVQCYKLFSQYTDTLGAEKRMCSVAEN